MTGLHMLVEIEASPMDPRALPSNPECDGCGRGLVERFGRACPAECDSCEAEFELLMRAGRIYEVEL